MGIQGPVDIFTALSRCDRIYYLLNTSAFRNLAIIQAIADCYCLDQCSLIDFKFPSVKMTFCSRLTGITSIKCIINQRIFCGSRHRNFVTGLSFSYLNLNRSGMSQLSGNHSGFIMCRFTVSGTQRQISFPFRLRNMAAAQSFNISIITNEAMIHDPVIGYIIPGTVHIVPGIIYFDLIPGMPRSGHAKTFDSGTVAQHSISHCISCTYSSIHTKNTICTLCKFLLFYEHNPCIHRIMIIFHFIAHQIVDL